ncbi:class D sortase [Candidatus Peregrinibacteria bacterium]|nr:class D sortase [Candidatus Peregrinibacteria bacterium]
MQKKKLRKKREHVYRLHIDAAPNKQQPVSSSRYAKVWAFLWDKIQFVLVSIVVFAVIYVVMNWQALSLIAKHNWDVWRGYKSPLERLVAEKPNEPEKFSVTPALALKQTPVPPLNLEVYPTEMRIIIPRINQNLPVVGVKNENLIARRWEELESDIQKALKNGVIHYPGTALPGDNGNVVITGHSSYYVWDPGRFKDVFALLHDVKMGDRIVVYFNQKKYIYEVNKIKVVLPKDVDVLGPSPTEQLTLITCTPIGTNLKRLIVQAKLVEKS